jgi:ABC-type nickel/cobalt efflux system permease component RcnA
MDSINRYLGVECNRAGHIRIKYWLDFAELPAYAELDDVDANHDGEVSPDEQRGYLARRVPPLVAQWTVAIDDVRASAHVTASSLEIYPGDNGLSALRILADVAVEPSSPAYPTEENLRVFIRDLAFSDRPGWRELTASDTGDAVVVSGSRESPSSALAYSEAYRDNPPRVNQASFSFRIASGATTRTSGSAIDRIVSVDPRLERIAGALRSAGDGPVFLLVALAIAIALGAAHALSPGHGKALAAATLVGRRAGPRHALMFGAGVALSHTAVVVVMGALAIGMERSMGSDRVFRWLEVASAVAVAAIGLHLLVVRWRALFEESTKEVHEHDSEDGHAPRTLIALGASSGLVPCPTALALWLSAIAMHRAMLGLLLVVAFSVGVATTLTAVGLVVLCARNLFARTPATATALKILPLVSAACVAAVGLLLCISSLSANSGQ